MYDSVLDISFSSFLSLLNVCAQTTKENHPDFPPFSDINVLAATFLTFSLIHNPKST